MKKIAQRRTARVVAGVAAVALIATGCSNNKDSDAQATATSATAAASSAAESSAAAAEPVKVKSEDGTEVTLTGPIAAKYSAATDAQRTDLGAVLTGDRSSGTRESGVVFQQFKGGVIIAKNADAGTPAYITWGRIRDAWNVDRAEDGSPDANGKNGSAGPLGTATSDETTTGTVKQTTFEHGKITYDTQTQVVEVTVNGKVVPSGL